MSSTTEEPAGAALVTGSSRGIGMLVAGQLLSRGWTVLGVSRGPGPGELEGERYRHERVDFSDAAALRGFVEGTLPDWVPEECQRLGLVNNAGVLEPMGPLPGLDPEALERAFRVNVVAPMLLTGAFLRSCGGVPLRIVDVSSGAATAPYPGWAAYCAGKSALRMVGQVVETELEEVPALRDRDVAVVSYAPHVVATRMQEQIRNMDEGDFPRLKRFQEMHERGQLVDPSRPAAEICDLLEADDLPRWSERRYQP